MGTQREEPSAVVVGSSLFLSVCIRRMGCSLQVLVTPQQLSL